jgi:outer membrane lipoprotein
MKKIGSILIVLVLFGCAAQAPVPYSKIPVARVSVAEVRADVSRFIGTEVRWGGVITRVENKAEETWVEVVSRQLWASGQPREAGGSGGRFIASFQGFFDPVVYKKGLQLTVLGSIKGQTKRLIGEHEYSFPLLSVTASYLWPVRTQPAYYDYPPPFWYYDPWPYYPWSHPHYFW